MHNEFIIALVKNSDRGTSAAISKRWKLSQEEAKLLEFLNFNIDNILVSVQDAIDMIMSSKNLTKLEFINLFVAQGRNADAQSVNDYVLPVFPITGADVIAAGASQGVYVGHILFELKTAWIDSKYTFTRDDLLEQLTKIILYDK